MILHLFLKELSGWDVIFRYIEESNVSDDADEECYDSYRDQVLPEGYTAYGGNGNVESVYTFDRYEYDLAESPTAHRPKQSFCEKMKSFCSDMGRLIREYNMF